MRVFAFILSVVIATALLMGGVVLLVLQTNLNNTIGTLVETVAMILFVYGPLTIGSFRAYWDVTGSEASRRYFRRLVLVIIGLEMAAALTTVAFAVTTSSGPLIPIIFIGTGAILTVAALLIGPVVYRYDRNHPARPHSWVAIEPSQIRKKILTVAITFVGVLTLATLGLSLINTIAAHTLDALQVLVFAVSFACIIAGCICIFSTLPWNRRLRDLTNRDPSRLGRIAKVVLRNKPLQLDSQDRTAAARYAAVVSITMSFQVAYLVLLYAGIVLQQINTLHEKNGDGFSIVIIVFLVAALVALLPLQVIRIRRARRYAKSHAAEMEVELPA